MVAYASVTEKIISSFTVPYSFLLLNFCQHLEVQSLEEAYIIVR